MTLLAGAVWTIVDDDGTGLTGTIANAAWVAAVKDSIEDEIHSPTNPTLSPFEITDEVVTARGAEASLDARLDAIEALIAAGTSIGTVRNILGQINMVQNEIFQLWPIGDTTAPVYWALAGAGGTVQRCGLALADTNSKIGDYCVRVRRVAATTTLDQDAFNSTDFAVVSAALIGTNVGYGAWVRATAIGAARIYITDGAGTTFSSANAAANTWEWLTVERVIDPSATTLSFGIQNDTNGADVYLSGPTVMFSPVSVPPPRWVPSPVIYHNYNFHISGNVATTQKFVFQPARPGIVRDVQLIIHTAPTGAALIVDVNTWDGAAYTSMFGAGKVTIADGAFRGGLQPDSTYARRCIGEGRGAGSTDLNTEAALSIDIDQVGSGVAGVNLGIMVRILHPARMWEAVLGYGFQRI